MQHTLTLTPAAAQRIGWTTETGAFAEIYVPAWNVQIDDDIPCGRVIPAAYDDPDSWHAEAVETALRGVDTDGTDLWFAEMIDWLALAVGAIDDTGDHIVEDVDEGESVRATFQLETGGWTEAIIVDHIENF